MNYLGGVWGDIYDGLRLRNIIPAELLPKTDTNNFLFFLTLKQ
ncbi:MAG: hypothetical protein RMX65_010465 [Nostoc sp. DedQUE01]